MPFDINEDRRLRVTWFKYQNQIYDMKHRKHAIISKMLSGETITKIVNEEQDDGSFEQHIVTYTDSPLCATTQEAEELFEQKIWALEQERRVEMKKIQNVVRAEKKIQKEMEADRKIILSALREERKKMREEAQKTNPQPPVRRSNRLIARKKREE